MSAAMSSFIPRDGSVHAVESALQASAEERRGAENRLVDMRTRRSKVLLDAGTTQKAILALESDVREQEILIERLDLVRPVLEAQLAEAQEAERREDENRQYLLACEAIATYRTALKEYAKLAKRIAEICQLERDAHTAMSRFQTSIGRGRHTAFSDPPPGFNGEKLSNQVTLPHEGGNGMLWGENLNKFVSIYSNVPVVV